MINWLKTFMLLILVKIKDIEDKIHDITNLTTTAAKTNEVIGEIPSLSGLVISAVLSAVENEIPDVNTLVKKADNDAKISEMGNKISPHLILVNLRIINKKKKNNS